MTPWTGLVCLRIWYLLRISIVCATNELPATKRNLSLCTNNEHGIHTTQEQRFVRTCQHQLGQKQFYEAVSEHPQVLSNFANAGYILRCYSNRLLAFIDQAKVFGLVNNFRTPTLSGHFRFKIHELMEEKHQRRDKKPSRQVLKFCNSIFIALLKNWSGSPNDGSTMQVRDEEIRFWSTNAKFYQNLEEKLRASAGHFNEFKSMHVERNAQDGMAQLAGGANVWDNAGQFIDTEFVRTYARSHLLRKHGCKLDGQYMVFTHCTETNNALRRCNERVNKLFRAGIDKLLRSNGTKFVSLANPGVPIRNSDWCTKSRTANDHRHVPSPSQRLAYHAARSTPAITEQAHLAIAWAAPDGITGDDSLCAKPTKLFTCPNQDGRSNVNDLAENINTNECTHGISKAERLHYPHCHVPPPYFIITHQIILHYTFKTYVHSPGDDDIAAITVAEPTETADRDKHIRSDDSGECPKERTVNRCSSIHDKAPGTTVYERTANRCSSIHDQALTEVAPGATALSVHASAVPECFSERFSSVCSMDVDMTHWHDASKSIFGEWLKSLEEIAHGPPLSGLTCTVVALRATSLHLGTNQVDKGAQCAEGRAALAKFECYHKHPMHAGVATEMYGLVGCSGRSLDHIPPMDQRTVSFIEKCIGHKNMNCSDCTLFIGHIPTTDVSSTLREAIRNGSKYRSMAYRENARNEAFRHPSDNLGVFCAILRIVALSSQPSHTNVGHSFANRGRTHELVKGLESRNTHGCTECCRRIAVHQTINSANDLCDKECTAENEAGDALVGLHTKKRSSGSITRVPCLPATDNEEGPAHHGKEQNKEKDKDSEYSCGGMTRNSSDSKDKERSSAEYIGVHANDPLAQERRDQPSNDCTTKRCSEPTPHAAFNGKACDHACIARDAPGKTNGAIRQRLEVKNTLRDGGRPHNVARSNARVVREKVESTPPIPEPCEHSTSYKGYAVKNGHRLRKDANPLVSRNPEKCDTLFSTEHAEMMSDENDAPSSTDHGNGTAGWHKSGLHGDVPVRETVRRTVGCDPRKMTKVLNGASCKEMGLCSANATSGNEGDCHHNPSTNHSQSKHRLVLRDVTVNHAQKRSTCKELPITNPNLEGNIPDENGKRAQTVHYRLPVATSCGIRAPGSNPSRDSRRKSAILHAIRARLPFGTECSCDYHLNCSDELPYSSRFSYCDDEEMLWHCNTDNCWCCNDEYPCPSGREAFVWCKTCSDKRYAQLFCPCNFDAQAHCYSGCNELEEREESQSNAEQSENDGLSAQMSDEQGKNDESHARRNGPFMTVLLAFITFVGTGVLIFLIYWV